MAELKSRNNGLRCEESWETWASSKKLIAGLDHGQPLDVRNLDLAYFVEFIRKLSSCVKKKFAVRQADRTSRSIVNRFRRKKLIPPQRAIERAQRWMPDLITEVVPDPGHLLILDRSHKPPCRKSFFDIYDTIRYSELESQIIPSKFSLLSGECQNARGFQQNCRHRPSRNKFLLWGLLYFKTKL